MSDELSEPRSIDSDAGRPASGEGAAQQARRWPGAVLLVILADLLFWHQQVGLSLALFAAADFVVATADVRPRVALVGPAALLACGALPAVEFVQALSVAFLLLR